MRRLFRLSLFVALLGVMALSISNAQKPQATVSGRVGQEEVRIFVKDSVYIIDRQYTIAGTLIVEPGTEIHFYPNGRLVDSVGGRIIADGFANAWYNQNPLRPNGTAINPIAPNSGYSGYADLDYFTYTGMYDGELQRTVYVDTERDLTVHENKYNYVFNVMLDKENRSVHNYRYDGEIGFPNPEYAEIITFEEAIMFYAARLNIDPDLDNRININPWKRLNDKDVNVEPAQIKFVGQPFNVSREWGHIVVLPGARAAFFRNCLFDGFRKDTTVDRTAMYLDAPVGTDLNMLNTAMRHYSNGSGGAITTFSSRTWLLDVEFTNNMARYRGGALQILQAPQVFPKPYPYEEIGYYSNSKNPNITERFGYASEINSDHGVPMIDLLDESWAEPMTDAVRQAYDDARIAVYLGRMRNMKFTGNSVELCNVKSKMMNGVPFVYHDYDEPAQFPQGYGNWAMGGAIFIEGSPAAENRQMEVGFGVNHSINVYTDREDFDAGLVIFPEGDTFVANGNSANNYQGSLNSYGARGGAIYVGKYTSLIVSGEFISNETYSKFLQNPENGSNSGYYSMGGAIFTENTFGRLQVRGGPERDLISNNTLFRNNKAGAGGAIFVDGNTDPHMSPIIGGSDNRANTRDYGYNILFEDNYAASFGGAVFTKRNFAINGAGGVIDNALLGYGGFYPVKFYNNEAGFSGGAVHVAIPNAMPPLPALQREIQLIRAEFVGNVVGENVLDISIPDIRGGGAFYTLNGDLNVVKGVEFRNNKVYNGNGGAVAMIHPQTSSKRFFLSDLDYVNFDWETLVADGFYSENGPFIYDDEYEYPADQRMLTRFLDNEIILDPEVLESQSGTGTTQIGHGTVGQSSQLLATTWLDQNTGFAVGLNGTIVRLTNGGVNWEYMNWNFQYRLNDIYFPTYNVGIIVGDRGIILRTTNNGQSWYEVRPPVETLSLNAVTFVGSTIGYAVGDYGRVLKTIDAGATWFDPVEQASTISDLYGVYFNDSDFGFAVGERGAVVYTFDGGETWEVINANTFADLNDIYFTDMMNGYIVGDFGVILHSADGGFAWSEKDVVTNQSFNSVHFTDLDLGYAVGEFGVIYKLTLDNGDLNIEELPSNTSFSLSDVFFPGNSTGFAVGDYGLMIGTNDAGATWHDVIPADLSIVDVVRYHPEIRLPENGIGLGGAIYILDSVTTNRIGRLDTIAFNRVRMQNNKSYTGAAVYSDNYDLKLLFNRSLITGNVAESEIGLEQNVIEGPAVKEQGSDDIVINPASSDLAGAIIYGEIQGPLPSFMYSEAANSIYNNHARFLIRLPDAPNTKGVLAGTSGIGYGGTDTLRGNYWGRTEADVNLSIPNFQNYPAGIQPTFYVDVDNERHLDYVFFEYDAQADAPNLQGPFENFGTKQSFDTFDRPYEQIIGFSYQPIPLENGADQNTVGDGSIPEKVLMSGWCYDVYDKHTDIKTADFANRRLSPIEDFAVGIPPVLRTFEDETQPSYGKYVKRWVRDPRQATDGILADLQKEWTANEEGQYSHPVGYPLFIETQANYEGLVERSNHDERLLNETVFFVINETTGDYIRVNLKQNGEDAPNREYFSGRVELVPDLTHRNPNTILRRSAEGLYNLGTGSYLLQQLYRDPYIEDLSVMRGRKYYGDQVNGFAGINNIFSNRPAMPASNEGKATFFAGEKYRALPVKVGDVVRVVSRTVLWTQGVDAAYEGGISFKIEESTEPPVFTGDINVLRTDTLFVRRNSEYPWESGYVDKPIPELLNKVFVTEDRDYPQPNGTYSNLSENAGRDSILAVTAVDINGYYDPASFDDPDEFSRLTYHWFTEVDAGARRWMTSKLVPASSNQNNPKDGALGYMVFQGQPINPYVVPGGEKIRVSAQNWPPHYRTVDWLRQQGFSEEEIAKYIYLFSPYLHANSYDVGEGNTRARYLQQDTIDFGRNDLSRYEFTLFVVETLPSFLFPNTILGEFKKLNQDGTIEEVDYEPSIFTCDRTMDNKVKANLTDKLRMQVDFNTDDEIEDLNAWADWDFRYGKTAYGFMNVARRILDGENDDVVIDTTFYDSDGDGLDDDVVITQTRPNWMANDYLYVYDDDVTTDPLGADFTAFGKLNIRVDRDEAIQLLTPEYQYNDNLNTDTLFTIVANDGHGGINFLDVPVFINVQPTIVTDALPNATEGQEYNMFPIPGGAMTDSLKMIKVYDPNFEQSHEFELIYSDYPDDEIPIDPCFEDAGTYDLTGLKTTPDWLKINPISGLLYGTPSVKDAPKTEDITVVVWDIIDGERQLPHLKTLTLTVDAVNHPPYLDNIPTVICIEKGSEYSDTLSYGDIDLLRDSDPEELTITAKDNEGNLLEPPQWIIEPSTITGPLTEEELANLKFVIRTDDFQLNEDPNDNRTTITIIIEDKAGEQSIPYQLKIKISEATLWACSVLVENTYPGNLPGDGMSAWQILEFGTAPQLSLPTTGDGTDRNDLGTLDAQFCEYELPPIPEQDIFDARWTVPTTNGIYRNIYPVATDNPGEYTYRARVQAGGEVGNTAIYYPIVISWDMTCIPDTLNNSANPSGGTWWLRDPYTKGNIFSVNMTSGAHSVSSSSAQVRIDGDKVTVLILDDNIDGFHIVYDWTSPVHELPTAGLTTGIISASPNPVTEETNLFFNVNLPGKVDIDVIDQLGNVVANVANSQFSAGEHMISWKPVGFNGALLSNGTYTVRMVSGAVTSTYKLVVIR